MRFKVVAVLAGLFVAALALYPWRHQDALAGDKPGRQRIEYKVVFSPIDHVQVRESRLVDGKAKEVEHGPAASAEAMTKQFNSLAAEGWEYVGPVAPTGKQPATSERSGVLSLFKRAMQ